MTGDDHGNGGTVGPLRPVRGAAARRAARSPTGSACAAPPTSTRTRRSPTRRPPRTRAEGFEIALHVTHQLRRLDRPGSARGLLLEPARGLRRRLPEPRRAGHQPHPLHRLERLGDAAEGRARARHPPRHELLLLAGRLGPGPPGHVHRLGDADALRRPRRHDDRRLPGGDPDDRRVRADLSVQRSTRCSTRRSARRATTASSPPTCTPTAPRSRARTRSSPRRRRAACRSSRPGRCSTGSTAATAPRSTGSSWNGNKLELHDRRRRRAPTACGRWCRRSSAVGALTGVTRERQRRSPTTDADDQGRRVRVLRRRRRQLRGDLRGRRHRAGDLQRRRTRSHGDGTATITWDTDEASDSRVDYGTEPELADLEPEQPGAGHLAQRRSSPASTRTRPTTTG